MTCGELCNYFWSLIKSICSRKPASLDETKQVDITVLESSSCNVIESNPEPEPTSPKICEPLDVPEYISDLESEEYDDYYRD